MRSASRLGALAQAEAVRRSADHDGRTPTCRASAAPPRDQHTESRAASAHQQQRFPASRIPHVLSSSGSRSITKFQLFSCAAPATAVFSRISLTSSRRSSSLHSHGEPRARLHAASHELRRPPHRRPSTPTPRDSICLASPQSDQAHCYTFLKQSVSARTCRVCSRLPPVAAPTAHVLTASGPARPARRLHGRLTALTTPLRRPTGPAYHLFLSTPHTRSLTQFAVVASIATAREPLLDARPPHLCPDKISA